MEPDQRPRPWGSLLLVVVAAAAALTAGLWLPSAVRSVASATHERAAVSAQLDRALAQTPDTARVTAGLVAVNTTLAAGQGAGTGIVLTPTGEVLTNNHVVEGATSIDAVDVGNGRRYVADVVGYDRSHDVAVLQLRGAAGLPVAPLGRSATLRVGDPVTAVGNAGGRGGPPAEAPGKVIGLGQAVNASDDSGGSEALTGLIDVQADVQAGDSGGAMVDRGGTVVGLTTAASRSLEIRRAGGEGFAIPIDQARGIAVSIVRGGGGPSVHRGPTAVLGIEVAADDGTGAPGSISVQGVDPGSSPDAAGLQPGDTLTTLDGRAVPTQNALREALGVHRPGDRVQLGWTDALGTGRRGAVRLIEGPPA